MTPQMMIWGLSAYSQALIMQLHIPITCEICRMCVYIVPSVCKMLPQQWPWKSKTLRAIASTHATAARRLSALHDSLSCKHVAVSLLLCIFQSDWRSRIAKQLPRKMHIVPRPSLGPIQNGYRKWPGYKTMLPNPC